ncbi:hypothetical protein VOLCADRAFT_104067 [Volvox carteri f. nagariensis]|uniref:Serine/threonine-protein phosphatase 2A activator n=1 Tax=Volvox carteri f. nagariensis TaxID=3068 RepID=D8TR09_VOLCA|nr:uncharacterized protein VOLCADRAFT_104067 [Volvox carteri f. nagariensis]EFJ50118.1 hypothetical protein VOLCADRAFT_104067 [Volvox carteri f. nagariensis]|eukprot:XP_002948738.1 hypothetical protein VOLCADRAFT_104067 [Volvox carteri f. nagariensis]
MLYPATNITIVQKGDLSPGFPTSAPYHTKDTLSPTAAPWASSVPHDRTPATLSPTKSIPSHTTEETSPGPARKRIGSAEDLKHFLNGQTVKDFMAFILSINEAVKGKKCNDPSYTPSPAVQRMCALLTQLETLVDEVPPEQQSLRYGNPAFRTWMARLAERAHALLESMLTEEMRPAVVELLPYFLDSFGNATRIDYGTGHETQFCALLYCLAKIGVFGEDDRQLAVAASVGQGYGSQIGEGAGRFLSMGLGLGLVIFKQYLELMHKIQTTYWLEPAGSHGVWGLDDYQFLPFIWGSAQLIAHPMIKPKSIHNPDILEAYASTYLYLNCVKFVKQVKKGPLGETSPMLNDISCVPTWAKVNSGMIKMYQVEVLSKFPIMQHFMFGTLLPFE